MSWVAATRSGRSSTIQTLMLSSLPPPPPPLSSELHAVSEATTTVARTSDGASAASAVMDGHEASGCVSTFVKRLDLCHLLVKH